MSHKEHEVILNISLDFADVISRWITRSVIYWKVSTTTKGNIHSFFFSWLLIKVSEKPCYSTIVFLGKNRSWITRAGAEMLTHFYFKHKTVDTLAKVSSNGWMWLNRFIRVCFQSRSASQCCVVLKKKHWSQTFPLFIIEKADCNLAPNTIFGTVAY